MTALSASQLFSIHPTVPQYRVLVVDDEHAILFAYRKLIKPEGFIVDTCENIQEAIDLIRLHLYLAIITDMRLSGTDNEDGIELLLSIRDIQPDARVVITTGHGSEKLKQSTQTLGVAHYFEKPVPPSSIVNVLNELRTAFLSASRMKEADLRKKVGNNHAPAPPA